MFQEFCKICKKNSFFCRTLPVAVQSYFVRKHFGLFFKIENLTSKWSSLSISGNILSLPISWNVLSLPISMNIYFYHINIFRHATSTHLWHYILVTLKWFFSREEEEWMLYNLFLILWKETLHGRCNYKIYLTVTLGIKNS